jgi:hypothetical protein
MPNDIEMFLGVKPPSEKSKGNIMDIWEKKEDGRYYCDNKDFSLSWQDILHDVQRGYLVPIRNKNPIFR